MQKRSGVMILSADTLLRDGLAALITMRTDYQVLVAGATVRELINRLRSNVFVQFQKMGGADPLFHFISA